VLESSAHGEQEHASERAHRSGEFREPAPWNLDYLDGEQDERYTPPRRGQGVHVFVMDTGIRTTHEEFAGRAVPGVDIQLSGGPVECELGDAECATDRHGHGTAVASVVAGETLGVAKGAQVYSVKMMNDQGGGKLAHYIEGLSWIMERDEQPKVVTSSVGGRFNSDSFTGAIDDAISAGILVVVAAGNQGDNACSYLPARIPAAITVSSMNRDYEVVQKHNYGSCVDMYAPGIDVPAACPDDDACVTALDGTSLAAPHVSGAAALLLEEHGGASPPDVDGLLKERAARDKLTDVRNAPELLLLSVKAPRQQTWVDHLTAGVRRLFGFVRFLWGGGSLEVHAEHLNAVS